MSTREPVQVTTSTRRAPRRAGVSLAALALVLGAARPLQDDDSIAATTRRLDDTRTVLEQWVETRRIISAEKRDWALGKELLEEQIEVRKRQIADLREQIAEAREDIEKAEGKRAELTERHAELEQAASGLADIARELEGRTTGLLARLPDPIRERVQPLSQQIPEPDAETKLSLSQRFQNVIGILNEVNKFNSEVSATSEVRPLPDGSSAEVTAIYVGIAHGYYVTGNELTAGVGRASADGWNWIPADPIAPDVARAVRILKNEEAAAFVPLPVELDAQEAEQDS